jgi:hypothetical protein
MMPEWITDILKAVLPGIIIAALTSVLTVRLALRRFHKEKWWEKKQEMYSSLLETLHHLKNYAAEHYEGQMNPDHITDEKREELTKDWKQFSREFAKLLDLASFHLSSEAVAVLDQYVKKKAEARKSDDIFDWIDGDLAAVTECLEELKKAAKRDLKVK